LEGHSAGMEIRGRGFCGALVNRGQSRVLSFFSFPHPRQAAAESEKSRADALPPQAPPPKPKTKSISSQAVRERVSRLRGTSLLLSAGEEVLVRFIRGDSPYSRFRLERQGTAVATTT
jgi:hypothetical protein